MSNARMDHREERGRSRRIPKQINEGTRIPASLSGFRQLLTREHSLISWNGRISGTVPYVLGAKNGRESAVEDDKGSQEQVDSPPIVDLEKLRAENEELKTRLAKQDRHKERGGFWRRFTVWLLIILACIFSVLGALSAWVKTTTLDTGTFVSTVAPLVKNDAVARAVSEAAVQQLFAKYDVTGQIKAGLNDISDAVQNLRPANLPIPNINLSIIAEPVSNGLQTFASKAAQKILQSDTFYKVWVKTLTVAHTAAVNILTGNKNAVVTSKGDKIVLNISPLINRVKTRLVDAGLTFLNNVKVPANVGQVTLFTAKQLGAAQGMVHLLETLSWVFPLLAFICFLLAAVIARNRRKALLREGIGLAIAMLVVLIIGRVAHNQLIGLVKKPDNLAAANVIWSTLINGLRQGLWAAFALGVVVAVGAALAGPSRWAVWTREHVADFFTNWRERREGKKGKTPFSLFMDEYAWWFRIGGLVLAVIILAVLPNISGLAVIVTGIVLLIYLGVLELLR